MFITVKQSSDEIPEILGGMAMTMASTTRPATVGVNVSNTGYYNYVKEKNGPLTQFIFRDPTEVADKLMVIIPSYGGVKDTRVSVIMGTR